MVLCQKENYNVRQPVHKNSSTWCAEKVAAAAAAAQQQQQQQ